MRKSRRDEMINYLMDEFERQHGAKSRLLREVFYPVAILLATAALLICIFL